MIALLGMGLVDLVCWIILLPILAILGFRCYVSSDDRPTLLAKWVSSVVLILIIAFILSLKTPFKVLYVLLPSVILGFIWMPSLGRMITKPLTGAFEGEDDEAKPKPFYYLAEGKRRQGLYEEAAAEIRKQLEQFPGDVEGMMRLATLQVEDMHNLPAGAATLNELLQQPDLAPNHAVAALQALADWQLNLARDANAAGATFNRIKEMFPDSPYAHMAEQRIAHLEGVARTRDFHEKTVFKVRPAERGLGLRKSTPPAAASESEGDVLAAECVQQLQKHPNDTETREKLAWLYAEQLERLDLAVDQLEQLTELPNETPQHIAHWLGVLATLHIRHGHDIDAAEKALRRILERFPNSAISTRAISRLATLQAELKAATATTVTKALGVYEKDVGLRGGSSI